MFTEPLSLFLSSGLLSRLFVKCFNLRIKHTFVFNYSTCVDQRWLFVVCSGVSRQAQPEAAEESEHQCQLVPVQPRDSRHSAVHHRPGKRPAAICHQGQREAPPPSQLGQMNIKTFFLFVSSRTGPCPRCPSLRLNFLLFPNLPNSFCQRETSPWQPCKSS